MEDKRIYNPLEFLATHRDKSINVIDRVVPPNHSLVRKIFITPSSRYYIAPQLEMSNRVLRKFNKVRNVMSHLVNMSLCHYVNLSDVSWIIFLF